MTTAPPRVPIRYQLLVCIHITGCRFDSYIHREIASRKTEELATWGTCVPRLLPVATSCIHHGWKVMERTPDALGHLDEQNCHPDWLLTPTTCTDQDFSLKPSPRPIDRYRSAEHSGSPTGGGMLGLITREWGLITRVFVELWPVSTIWRVMF